MGNIYSISDNGLTSIEGKEIKLKAGTACYIGYSSSPKFVIITGMVKTDNYEIVNYMTYPYLKELREDIGIFKDLAKKGTQTEIKNLKAYAQTKWCYDVDDVNRRIKDLENFLSGNVDALPLHDYKDYQYYEVIIKQVKPVECPRKKTTGMGNYHAWYYLECFGSVGGKSADETENTYLLDCKLMDLKELQNDDRFEIVSSKLDTDRGNY